MTEPMAEAHEGQDGYLRRSDMTLRDWFAGQALSGLIANSNNSGSDKEVSNLSYRIAAAMLEARK